MFGLPPNITTRTGTAFAGYRFPAEVIRMAVRWSTRYRLSTASTRDLLAEPGIDVSDPLLADAARQQARDPLVV